MSKVCPSNFNCSLLFTWIVIISTSSYDIFYETNNCEMSPCFRFSDQQCKYCFLLLNNDNDELIKHCKVCPQMMRSNINNRFMCYACGYFTAEKYYMRRHIRIHTGEKPFQCSFCPYRSNQKSAVKNHIRIKH